jgi:uncharacterized membrane protein
MTVYRVSICSDENISVVEEMFATHCECTKYICKIVQLKMANSMLCEFYLNKNIYRKYVYLMQKWGKFRRDACAIKIIK